MFSGIVEELGYFVSASRTGATTRLEFAAGLVTADMAVGGSIAVNGCCLTVVRCSPTSFGVDAVDETLSRTNLGQLEDGEAVNLERPVAIGDRLGGPPRAGPRGRRRHRRRACAPPVRRGTAAPRAVPRGEGLGRGRRLQPDARRRGARAGPHRGRPAHGRGDDARPQGPWRAREPGGRHRGEVRRASPCVLASPPPTTLPPSGRR